MKTKRLFISMLVMALIPFSASAKIWRVNNQSNYNGTNSWGNNYGGTAAYPVFKQINQAVGWSGVVANDTLHVEGSSSTYDAAIITKKLVIIGPGYFLSLNPKVSNTTYDARVKNVEFQTGSANSQLIGVNLVDEGSGGPGWIEIRVNGVTIKRCRIEKGIRFGTLISDVYILINVL